MTPDPAPLSASSRFEAMLFEADSLDAIPYDDLRQTITRHSVACVRGLFNREALIRTYDSIASRFDLSNDRRHNPANADAVRRNFQKLQIGGRPGVPFQAASSRKRRVRRHGQEGHAPFRRVRRARRPHSVVELKGHLPLQ